MRKPAERPAYPPIGKGWSLPTIEMPSDRFLVRLSSIRYPDPRYFGRSKMYRFDAPGAEYGVCYLGTSLDCCIIETLTPQGSPLQRFIPLTELQARYAAKVNLKESLLLAHLCNDGLVQLGIDQRHTGGDDYDLSQAWSFAIHNHPANVDGILYASRHHNDLYSVAIFERCADKLEFHVWGRLNDTAMPDLDRAVTQALRRFHIIVV